MPPRYAIIGGGSEGVALSKRLSEASVDHVLIVPEGSGSVADGGAPAIPLSNWDVKSVSSLLEGTDGIVLIPKSKDMADAIVREIRSMWADKPIIIKDVDGGLDTPLQYPNVRLIKPHDIMAREMFSALRQVVEDQRIRGFREALNGREKAAVFIHNNPDPDAIGSALGLIKILESFGMECSILYGGKIEHQENRALVNALDVSMVHLNDIDDTKKHIEDGGAVILLDMALPGANNFIPDDVSIDIVIDHHQFGDIRPSAKFVDVRLEYGSTSTMVTEYIRAFGVEIDEKTATALLYGIRTDTHGFLHGMAQADIEAVGYLYSRADISLIEGFESPPMSIGTMDVLGKAIMNRDIRGPYLVSCVEIISERDAIPQAADFLMRLEGVATALVFGIVGESIHLSARSNDPRVNIGQVLQEAFGEEHAGGHMRSGAGQLPLGIFGNVDEKAALIKLVESAIKKRFFSAVGVMLEGESVGKEDGNSGAGAVESNGDRGLSE